MYQVMQLVSTFRFVDEQCLRICLAMFINGGIQLNYKLYKNFESYKTHFKRLQGK